VMSLGMLELVAARRATHLAWLSRPRSATAHVTFCLANKKVKAVVSRDAHAYVKHHVD
jgi:hypothetical protein